MIFVKYIYLNYFYNVIWTGKDREKNYSADNFFNIFSTANG